MAVKSAGSSILQLHLPERWPDTASFSPPLFQWTRYQGGEVEHGASRLEEIGPARQVIAIAPAQRVLFARARLPAGRAGRDPKVLRNAIEDALVSGLDEIHAVPVATLPGGESLIAVVDLAWVRAAYEELEAHHLAPARLICEGELCAGTPAGTWTVVRTATGGFVHTAGGETIALDGSNDSSRDEVPLALNLLVDERTQAGASPESIVVHTSQSSLMPSAEVWSKALAVKVSYAGPWQPETMDARPLHRTDLLAGAGVRKQGAGNLATIYRWPLILLAAVIVAHLGLTAAVSWRLSDEAAGLRAEMDARFRKVFPDARAVPDPVLQMSRNLDAARRGAGALESGDYIALFGAVAPQLAAAGAKAKSVRYERGQLSLDLTFADRQSIDALEQSLRAAGVQATIDHVANAAAGAGASASLRIVPSRS